MFIWVRVISVLQPNKLISRGYCVIYCVIIFWYHHNLFIFHQGLWLLALTPPPHVVGFLTSKPHCLVLSCKLKSWVNSFCYLNATKCRQSHFKWLLHHLKLDYLYVMLIYLFILEQHSLVNILSLTFNYFCLCVLDYFMESYVWTG